MRSQDDVYPVSLKGKILLSDGTETAFSIQPDLGWQQWGNARNQEGAMVRETRVVQSDDPVNYKIEHGKLVRISG